jgi:hypothetical protein
VKTTDSASTDRWILKVIVFSLLHKGKQLGGQSYAAVKTVVMMGNGADNSEISELSGVREDGFNQRLSTITNSRSAAESPAEVEAN